MEAAQNFHTVRGYQQLDIFENHLTSAMEDYLEMICRNKNERGYIRINTLSELLNVAAPSATKMVQNLSKLGLVDYKKYEFITLTQKGEEIGKYLLYRHSTIEALLKNLGVKDNILTNIELIEHDISTSTLRKINCFNKFLEQHPDILQSYEKFEQSKNF